MLKIYTMHAARDAFLSRMSVYAQEGEEPAVAVIDGEKWLRYSDVEPLLKRLAELEAKEQVREQFDLESA